MMTSTTMQKICFLSSVHPTFDTRIFYKEAKSLISAGYDITLITQHEKQEIVDGIKLIPIPKPRNRLERMTKTVWIVFKKALNIDADVYHIHDPELLPIARLLIWKGKLVVYDMHENVPKQILKKDWVPRLFRKYLSSIISLTEKLLLVNIPVIFAEKSYHKNYPWVVNHTTVLNMPLASHFHRLRKKHRKSENFSIGYIGDVSEARGSIIAIEVLRILNRSGFEINFECIGPVGRAHKKQIFKLCEKYNLHNVNLHGFMPAFEGLSIIAQCCIGLAILQPIPNYIESYPTKMFEYMALGLPVIVSDFPLWREIVEDSACGLLVNPSDHIEIADAVIYLLENPEKAEAMGQNGRRIVDEKFNWGVEEKKLLNFYSKIIM